MPNLVPVQYGNIRDHRNGSVDLHVSVVAVELRVLERRPPEVHVRGVSQSMPERAHAHPLNRLYLI